MAVSGLTPETQPKTPVQNISFQIGFCAESHWYQVRAAAVVFYLLGKLQVEGVMRDL